MAPLAERPHREFLFSETTVWGFPLDKLDLHDLRWRFGDLFDRANRALQLTGYDLDDTVFERFIVCRRDGEEERIPVNTLTDPEALIATIYSALAVAPHAGAQDGGIEVTALRVDVILERMPGEPGLPNA